MAENEQGNEFVTEYALPSLMYAAAILFPFSLLLSGLIGGSEYIALNSLLVFTFGVYKLHPRIIEFSIAGNSVRLKETLDEAERITEELKEIKNITMSHFFSMMSDVSGGQSIVMKRYYDFFTTYNLLVIRKENIDIFKPEIIQAITCLIFSLKSEVQGHFAFRESDDEFIVNVRILRDTYNDASEEDIAASPGISKALDACTAIILLNDVYLGIKSGVPKPVEIPSEIIKYKIDVEGRFSGLYDQ